MNYDELIKVAKDYGEKYLKQEKLGHDEELQLLSCGYSVLFLSACANKSPKELGLAHEFGSSSMTGAVRESVRMVLPQTVLTKGTANAPNQVGIYHWTSRL